MATKIYEIQVTQQGQGISMNPSSQTAAADDQIQWTINAGTGIVCFLAKGAVDFASDMVTAESPASGIAMMTGEHQFAVNVWLKNQQSRVVYGTLIIV